ncbi:MBL fold metallo-hydrolase [Paenibacillus beijingensis]|uniref:Metallo-beta-lactamase domain-containing protein n=1 Tax=Paenibacillus beijingensis TaxID=1126833 RepID=A0A0D5NHF8_9BACL|nr:MBL fold metallo-hydrolase [Paenibacillus beijingensis]AJY74353.1 hypothetical protein VN24_06905 [Paenibacillus beijingensis]
MKLQLIRHATLRLDYRGVCFLIDPMLSDAGVNPPIPGSTNDRRNPLVPLPEGERDWLHPDAVLVTHLHPDHWDEAAAKALPKSLAVLCQPGDEEALRSFGFASVAPIERETTWRGVTIARTEGRHGTGEIGARMGRVSGFVLRADGEPTLYIAGDTIWCQEVQQALDEHRPALTVANAGGARFAAGDPITMDADGVVALCRYAPYTKAVAVHMDAINHCLVTRADLRERLAAEGLLGSVSVPGDGQWVTLM